MSQLRRGRNPDGTREIVRLDDGATGRVTFSRLGIRGGGEYVTPMPRKTTADYNREARARNLCGRPLETGPCARNKDHGWECRSFASLENAAERRARRRL